MARQLGVRISWRPYDDVHKTKHAIANAIVSSPPTAPVTGLRTKHPMPAPNAAAEALAKKAINNSQGRRSVAA
jgi:hypothetical protein